MRESNDTTPPERRRPTRASHFGQAAVSFFLGIFAMVAVIGLALIGQTIRAPDWVRENIETRVEESLGGLRLGFSDIEFVMGKGWRPRVRLRDMELAQPDGASILHLSNAEASLAMRPLLRGEVKPKNIYLFGAYAILRRDLDGNIQLFFGDGHAPFRSADTLHLLIEQWDQQLTHPQLSALTSVEIEALTLRFEDLRANRAWTLDGGRIRLDRDKDRLEVSSSFALLGGGDVASLFEASYSSLIGDPRAEFGVSVSDVAAGDLAAQAIALNWLGVLDAPISGAMRGSVDENGALGPLSATLQIGAGVLQPNRQARPIPFDGARSYFTYSPEQQVLIFDELSVASAWGSGMAEGVAYLGAVESGRLQDLVGQFSLSEINLNPRNLYDAPLTISRALADFRLELDPFRLTLGQGQIAIGDSSIQLNGGLDAEQDGWHLALNGEIDRMTPGRLLSIWPERAAPKPRLWVTDNLHSGLLRNIGFAIRSKPGAKPVVSADFDFQDSTVRFMRSMPPITAAAGHASLFANRFAVTASAGRIVAGQGGAVDVSGTSFIIPDIGIRKEAPGVVRVSGAGPVTAVVSLLDRPPLSILKGTPLPVALADGRTQVAGTLALPLKKRLRFDEIEFHLEGDIRQASSEILVPGHKVTADSLKLTGNQGQIEISGQGLIDRIPARIRWRQPLGRGVSKASRVEGTIELSRATVDTFNVGLPDDSVSGKGEGQFTLDLAPGQPPALSLTSDLHGLRLHLSQIGWHKPPHVKGALHLSGVLGETVKIDKLSLRGAGLNATGSVLSRSEGGLDRALFSSVRMGDWLDARVEMVGQGSAAPTIRILGGTLDLRRADFGAPAPADGGGGGGGSGAIDVHLDRLQVTDTIALSGFDGTFQTAGGMQGDFTGLVNGQTRVAGTMIPQPGGSAFRIRSEDAGGVFRSSGVLRQGRGGDFNLTLVPDTQPGQFRGQLRVTNTQVKDAPAIAALINSISLIGLLDELSGQGIQFTEVDAKFVLGPSRLTLVSSSAVGPSIGISMDGIYDVPTGQLNMQGVISPVYLLNSIGSVLTRKGEGVLGFSYTLRGTSDDPSVSVNPLSALAPGIFREIFRAPPPKVPGEEPEKPDTGPSWSDGAAEGR